MKTHITILSVSLILAGCASMTQPIAESKVVEINSLKISTTMTTPKEPRPIINEECSALAKFARSIATMRDSGVPMDDIHLLVTNKPEFPANPVIREVYTRKDISPDAGATNAYAVCLRVGYSNMVASLQKAEDDNNAADQARIKSALAAKKSKLKTAQKK